MNGTTVKEKTLRGFRCISHISSRGDNRHVKVRGQMCHFEERKL